MAFLTDKNRVLGLGSAKDGTEHWWAQRVSAIALIPLAVLFVIPFAHNLGQGYDRAVEAYSHPVNAIVAILFFITAFHHLKLGMQVVVEDYVHGPWRTVLLLANTMFAWVFGLTGVFAVAKIAL